MAKVSVENRQQVEWLSQTFESHHVSDDALGQLQDKLDKIEGVSGSQAVPAIRRAVREVADIHHPSGENPAYTLIQVANAIKLIK